MKLLLISDSIVARKEGLKEPRLNATLKKLHQNLELNNTAVSGVNSGVLWVAGILFLGNLIVK
ncbi:hypothetical protein PT287_01465 [Lactobacillus sp. ESL0679]|uniref:hypothetical protein n=1 Tax=Lactobacillus sp. ESL0679 TaxID=2983209 RepID=UPI0023F7F158|nr:hypothetical protein [Lactobacillus sp. ESL0679]MDF7682189.1 hypothetical protein [Lactobacillus sp. ESL0679]